MNMYLILEEKMVKRNNKDKREILMKLKQSLGETSSSNNVVTEIYHASTNSLEVIRPVALNKEIKTKGYELSEEDILKRVREQRRM